MAENQDTSHIAAYASSLRFNPKKRTETPADATLILEDGSRHPVHKLVLAAQSEFFEGLFSFQDKKEYELENPTDPSDPNSRESEEVSMNPDNPILKKYLTDENMIIVLDSFYQIDSVAYYGLSEEKILEIIILADYFLAHFLIDYLIDELKKILDLEATYDIKNFEVEMKEMIKSSRNAEELKEALDDFKSKRQNDQRQPRGRHSFTNLKKNLKF